MWLLLVAYAGTAILKTCLLGSGQDVSIGIFQVVKWFGPQHKKSRKTIVDFQHRDEHVCVRAQLCPTLWPHEVEPARLLSARCFPSKNIRVGSHLLLQGIFPTQTQLASPVSPALAGRVFITVPSWEAPEMDITKSNKEVSPQTKFKASWGTPQFRMSL